ncbi:MAG: GTPase Era [Buchnera aphidicola (Tetraneura akinire)]
MNIKKNKFGKAILLGRTNVGKSTFLNKIMNKKISITSRKKNTTKSNIFGIHTKDKYQTIYIDTPGFQKNNKSFFNYNLIIETIKLVQVIIFIIDRCKWTQYESYISNIINKNKIPVIVLINKIDLIKKKIIMLPFINFLKKKIKNAKEIVPISATKKINCEKIQNMVINLLPIKNHQFKKEQTHIFSLKFELSEIIREKIIRYVGDEIPLIVDVKIEFLNLKNKNTIYLIAIVLVNNNGQKKIIIGKNGKKIKLIITISSQEIKKRLNKNVNLKLHVKIKKKI